VSRIRGSTRVVAILGDPVEHSRSPAMHNAAFEALGLDFVYVALRVRRADLGQAIAGVRALGIAGLNVTVPHKEAIIPFLDRLSPEARAIGAVNTVVRRGRRLEGYNTDAEGFLRAVRDMGFRPRGRHAVVLGAGGSARAVAHALVQSGIRRLTILNRHLARAAALLEGLDTRGVAIDVGRLALADSPDGVFSADLIVNCTSLGLDGKTVPPFEIKSTRSGCLFYDLVYGPHPTPFVAAARRQGRTAENGERMLLEQARLAFRIWTGRAPRLAVMQKSLRRGHP